MRVADAPTLGRAATWPTDRPLRVAPSRPTSDSPPFTPAGGAVAGVTTAGTSTGVSAGARAIGWYGERVTSARRPASVEASVAPPWGVVHRPASVRPASTTFVPP